MRSNIRHDSYNRPKEYLDSITTLARQIKHLVENDPLTVFPLDEMQELDQVKSFFHEYEDVVPAETTDNDAAAPTLERHMQGPDSWVVIYPWLPDAELQYRDWRPFEEQPYLYDLFMQQGAAARIHIHQTAVDITDEQQKTMLDQALEQATESNTLFSIVLNPDWFSDARYTPFVLQLMQKPWSGNLVIPDAEEDQQAWIAPLQAMATDRVVISEMPPGTVEQHRTQLDLMINGQQERMLKFGQVHQIAEGVGPLRKPNVQGPQIQNNPLSA
ncbi:MAG TPA: hypothetical protein DCE41_15090 [Cytophagales bacterium]|nr:hypothetical protein [Cytophagales bacterium]